MLLSMALCQNWTDILGEGGMLHPTSGFRRLNYECEICMLYCLQSWTHISEKISIPNVLESCGFGWLRSIQEVPVCTYLEDVKTKTAVPSGPSAPSNAVRLKDVRSCRLGTQIISLTSLCNLQWGVAASKVCIIWVASCMTHCLEIENQAVIVESYILANTLATEFAL